MQNTAYNILTTAITCMVQEAGETPRNILKSWDDMRASQNAVEAFGSLPEDDPNANMILKACGGQFQASIGDWLKGKRTAMKTHHEAMAIAHGERAGDAGKE